MELPPLLMSPSNSATETLEVPAKVNIKKHQSTIEVYSGGGNVESISELQVSQQFSNL